MTGAIVPKAFDLSVGPFTDITGKLYGFLLATKYAGRFKRHEYWEFLCDCGETVTRRRGHVISGSTSSCGCYRREHSADMLTIHTLSKTRPLEFRSWMKMKERCLNPNTHNYADYGGRQIAICDRWLKGDGWLTGFECFFIDMLEKPSPKHSLDRYPDNNGNYEPGNCRWATAKEQANNRRPRRKTH